MSVALPFPIDAVTPLEKATKLSRLHVSVSTVSAFPSCCHLFLKAKEFGGNHLQLRERFQHLFLIMAVTSEVTLNLRCLF